MKKSTKIILGTTVAATAATAGASYLLWDAVMNRDLGIYDAVNEYMNRDNESPRDPEDPRRVWYYKQMPQKFEMINDKKQRLKAKLFAADEPSNKYVFCSHGYRSTGDIEFDYIVKFYHDIGVNVFIPDHQAAGESDGKYISFGYYEAQDSMLWLKWMNETFGEDIEIFLHGISMGCATVMMLTGDHELPSNVKFTVADCGYTSCTAQFEHILNDTLHIPAFPLLYTTDLINRLKSGFDYNDISPIESVGRAKVPMLFIHGSEDDFVPTYMVHQLYAACSSEKDLLVVKDAGHADSYILDSEAYETKVKEFIEKYISK